MINNNNNNNNNNQNVQSYLFFIYIYRALDKLYFQKSTVLVHFLKKSVTRNFYEYGLCVLKTYTKKDKVIISIEPGLTACFPRLFINKKVNSMIFNFSLA